MSWERLIEERLRRAAAEGEFDNLPGAGKLLDLDAYFSLPEDVRVGFRMLRDAGILPEELQLLKDIEALKQELAATSDSAQRRELTKRLNEKTMHFNLLMEQRRK